MYGKYFPPHFDLKKSICSSFEEEGFGFTPPRSKVKNLFSIAHLITFQVRKVPSVDVFLAGLTTTAN